ncbi:MAG: hypothetical protein E7317_04850, partial [Clostridiales bacterium]|nr:hypothetical protein [Clostridiales bacterium]
MIPFGNEAVTLVRRLTETGEDGRTRVSYETVKLTGCSWRRTRTYRREGEVTVAAEGITCRVPYGQEVPRVGDLMILGDVEAEVTSGAEFQALIEALAGTDGAFVVASVKDNAREGMPVRHYAARSA